MGRDTYFIHMGNNTIADGPKLTLGRYSHGCHEMIINGQDCVVVTGGFGALNSTEILVKSNLANGWMLGPDLPIKIAYHQMVSSPDKQSGYTIGGHDDDRNKDIFKFSCSNTGTCQWNRVDTK